MYASVPFPYVWNISMIMAIFQFCEILSFLQSPTQCHLLHEAFPKHLSLDVTAEVWVRQILEWYKPAWSNQLITGSGITFVGSHQYWSDYLAKFIYLSQEWIGKRDVIGIKKRNLYSIFKTSYLRKIWETERILSQGNVTLEQIPLGFHRGWIKNQPWQSVRGKKPYSNLNKESVI